ncbi:hypothetical protein ACFYXH_08065 [Streptomyces sp. NPDC002730]|uniref:hypothetical protein n=1 Tax=Streptomyces sp. NPDC002730 TaxID=3364662 RepID=UPI0036A7A094
MPARTGAVAVGDVIATAMMSASATTTTSATSSPTAAALIMLTMRVEATASNVWMSSTTSVIRRAVPSSGSMSASGMNAWLASALSTAATPIAR